MSSDWRLLIRTAFERTAGHMANLDRIREAVEHITESALSLDEAIGLLRREPVGEDITLMTDIRILINEIEHMVRRREPSE
ncbi:MAG: hypothetical protein ACP6IT_03775 [Candidatus Thorarchaeota archaeon]